MEVYLLYAGVILPSAVLARCSDGRRCKFNTVRVRHLANIAHTDAPRRAQPET